MMNENWKSVPWSNGFYEVSDHGNVRSCDRTYFRANGRPFAAAGRPVPCRWSDGYQRVRLNVPGFPKWHTVHKLVLEAFVGERPAGAVIRHLDGDSSNNKLSNLAYGTNAENQADRKAHGTSNQEVASRLMTDPQIVRARERRAAGEKLKVLAADYGVTMSYITMICTGKMAGHLGGPIVKPLPVHLRARKLTDQQIEEIIRRRAAGEKIVPLGREFGVCHSRISKIYQEATREGKVSHAAE